MAQKITLNPYYVLPVPTLKNQAEIQIVASLFRKHYENNYLGRQLYSTKNDMTEAESACLGLLEKLPLPNQLKNEVKFMLKCMASELYSWTRSPVMEHYENKTFVKDILWTPYGTVDEVRTFLKQASDGEITEDKIIRSSRLCLKDFLEENMPKSFYSSNCDAVLHFWIVNSKKPVIKYEDIMDSDSVVVRSFNVHFTKYFCSLAPYSVRCEVLNRILTTSIYWNPVRLSELMIHVFSSLSEKELLPFFQMNAFNILLTLIQFWPVPQVFWNTFELILKHNCLSAFGVLKLCRNILFSTRSTTPLFLDANAYVVDIWNEYCRYGGVDTEATNYLFNIVTDLILLKDNLDLVGVFTKGMWLEVIKLRAKEEEAKRVYAAVAHKNGPKGLDDFLTALNLSEEEKQAIYVNTRKDFAVNTNYQNVQNLSRHVN